MFPNGNICIIFYDCFCNTLNLFPVETRKDWLGGLEPNGLKHPAYIQYVYHNRKEKADMNKGQGLKLTL